MSLLQKLNWRLDQALWSTAYGHDTRAAVVELLADTWEMGHVAEPQATNPWRAET